jgi:hypothetical protein
MIVQHEFPFGNPTKESRMITAIIFISIIAFTAAEIVNLYKIDKILNKSNE